MDATLELRLATAADVEAMRDVEVDAGVRFRHLPAETGLAEIADDDPPAADVLLAHIDNATSWVVVDHGTDADGDADVDLTHVATGVGSHADAGVVVGYALASMMDGQAHLDQVSVRAAWGRRGIGTALVHATCRWATEQQFVSITLTTYRDVAFNGPYYARLGFVEVPDDELGPELRSLRELEEDIGLDIQPRVVMRRRLG